MIDLAIAIDTDRKGTTVIETNKGLELKAPGWPRDCEFQLVAFGPAGRTCEIILTDQLADDISKALLKLETTGAVGKQKPDWYRRLMRYARGASGT